MKRFIFAGISMFAFTLAGAASANATQQVTPFNLVDLARNGYFQEQGIPGHGALGDAIESQRVNAAMSNDKANANAQNRLASETLNDEDYLNLVEIKLDDLVGD
jgi:hypothetical protein